MLKIKHGLASVLLGFVGFNAGFAHAFQNGPDPTLSSVQTVGPYAITSQVISGNTSWAGGTVFVPTTAGKYAVVAFVPGYTNTQTAVQPLARRLASHGFVVMTINTRSRYDYPSARATQLLASLRTLTATTTGAVAGKMDTSRQAVAGYSMGGGGALEAASVTPALKAVNAFAPWDQSGISKMASDAVPASIFTGTSDTTASYSSHGKRFYDTIPASTEKMIANITGATHSAPTTVYEPASYMSIAWMKRWADGDTRYTQFLVNNSRLSNFFSTTPF